MNVKKEKWQVFAWYLLVFLFLYVWFSRIHPVVVYDGDDWMYTAYVRRFYPTLREWNPSRIFPEVFMPLCSAFAVHAVAPVTGDLITSLTQVHAAVISLFIVGYLYAFARLIRSCFSLTRGQTALISMLFLILHFLILRTEYENNLYLFYCVNITCYYYYLIPSLYNAVLVMYMMERRHAGKPVLGSDSVTCGVMVLILYLAIFSNLPCSGIIAAYAGSILLMELIRLLREKGKLLPCVKENALYFGILAAWLVSAVYELCGDRASALAEEIPILYRLKLSVFAIAEVLLGCNRSFWITVLVIFAAALFLLLRSKGKEEADRMLLRLTAVFFTAAVAIGVYSAVLCAAVSIDYAYRVEYLFGLFFYGLLIVMLAACHILRRQPKAAVILPLALCMLLGQINTYGDKTFRESNMSQADPEICAQISRDILEQFAAADAAGAEEMILYVPQNTAHPETEDNWPHSLFLMERLPALLYEQGIISRRMEVTPVIDSSMNERYNLPIPTSE